MKNSKYKPGTGEASHYAVSAFTRELIDEVARDHYSLRAWQTLLSRSWVRSLEDVRKSPARTRSFWSWVAVVAATGAGIILLALRFQTAERALTALLLWLPWYAGAVFFVQNAPAIITGRGLLRLDQVQLAGKRVLSGTDFVRGQPEFVGSRLG